MTDRKSKLTKEALRPYRGRFMLIRHMFYRNVCFSDGFRYVAEVAELFWLIDFIAGWINNMLFRELAKRDQQIASVHFWRLEVQDQNTVVTAYTDRPDEPFTTLCYPSIDLQLKSLEIWAEHDGEDWTLYLAPEDQSRDTDGGRS